METIEEAKKYLHENIRSGLVCPCCGQFVKLYPTILNVQMARWLIEIVKEFSKGESEWIEHKSINARVGIYDGSYAKLRYWGLIEQREKDESDENKKWSGLWRPTQKGIGFVYNQLKVPAHVLLYNRTFYGYEGEDISIKEALKNRFNYSELMGYTSIRRVKELSPIYGGSVPLFAQ